MPAMAIIMYMALGFALAAMLAIVLVKLGVLTGERGADLTVRIFEQHEGRPRVLFYRGPDIHETDPDQAEQIARKLREMYTSAEQRRAEHEHGRQVREAK